MITPTIIKCKRKSISIIIDKENNLIVRAPKRCSNKEIFEFINQKQNWINSKLNQRKPAKTLNVETGAKINILDKSFTLVLTQELTNKMPINLQNDIIYLPINNAKQSLINKLKFLARNELLTRCLFYAKNYNFVFSNLRIGSATSCWGSCSSKNSLNFSYKLLLCPNSVVNYIVVHELCHTKQKNHSKQFYALVANILPNYKNEVEWLKTNGNLIYLI